jgi:hypothetical protein
MLRNCSELARLNHAGGEKAQNIFRKTAKIALAGKNERR